jgi:hypothetical protein
MRESPKTPRKTATVRLLVLALVASIAITCRPSATISIVAPLPGLVVDDPSVVLAARVATAFDPMSVEVRVDGVDLIAALGLTPPFANVSGTVSIGGQPIQVTAFRYDTSLAGNPKPVDAVLTGLPEGAHDFAVRGLRLANGQLATDLHTFIVSSPLALALDAVPASASRAGAVGSAGTLAYGTLGGALAGPPVPLADGGALRPGFVPAAEGRISGAP